jgi:DNA-directed RNA polymerase specialized sigma24 family protein
VRRRVKARLTTNSPTKRLYWRVIVYYHEKSVDEAAQIFGISPSTVKTRMFYARKRLAELLKGAGLDRA